MSGRRHDDMSWVDGGEYAMGNELKVVGIVMSLVGMKVGEIVGLFWGFMHGIVWLEIGFC